jgi:aspartyl-tRNA(Asn)/glutamyl-tRNA(Gln) amidotransferase subunit C
MIELEEVKNIAKLARIAFTEEELLILQKELSSILDYVDKLKEIEIGDVNAYSNSGLLQNILRKDIFSLQKKGISLVELSPHKKDNFVKVKSIFNGRIN